VCGLIQDDCGLIQDDCGLIQDECGLIQDDSGLIQDECGLIQDDCGLIQDDSGLILTVATWILTMLFRTPLFVCRVCFQDSNKGSAMRSYVVDLPSLSIHLQWKAEVSYKAVYSWLVAALPSQVHDLWTLEVSTDDELCISFGSHTRQTHLLLVQSHGP
jgi:hypothetical protein